MKESCGIFFVVEPVHFLAENVRHHFSIDFLVVSMKCRIFGKLSERNKHIVKNDEQNQRTKEGPNAVSAVAPSCTTASIMRPRIFGLWYSMILQQPPAKMNGRTYLARIRFTSSVYNCPFEISTSGFPSLLNGKRMEMSSRIILDQILPRRKADNK